jgi:hypothetical protein
MDRPRDPFDDLADLFLSPEFEMGETSPEPRPAAPDPREGPAVRVAMVGHLPVSAGLWITQFADRLAREEGPVGVVRFIAGQVQVEVLRAGLGSSIAEALDLEQALEAATRLAGRWVVVPEASTPPAEVLRSGASSLLLMTGADEAAVVGAYRLIKAIAEDAMVESLPLPRLQVAVLGAGEAKVAEAMAKLNRTASAFLGMELPLALAMQRMEPVQSSYRLTLPAPRALSFQDIPRLLEDLLRQRPPQAAATPEPAEPPPIEAFPAAIRSAWPFAQEPQAADSPPQPGSPASPIPPLPPLRGDLDSIRGLVAGRAAPWSSFDSAVPAAAVPPAAATPSPLPAGQLPPRPCDLFAAVASASEGEGVIRRDATFPRPLTVRFPHLRPLPVQCPYHTGVELAVDAARGLHLLAPLSSLEEVQAVAGWVRDHASLLRLACPGVDRLEDHELAIDLVTDRPDAAAALATSRLRVHLLLRVEVGGSAAWIRLPLNPAARRGEPAESGEATR